jgi:hypothetical protein
MAQDEYVLAKIADSSQGINVASDLSSFELNLEQPIMIPKKAQNCYLWCPEATVWNTSPNILIGVNDKLYIEHATLPYVITFEQGLYDLNQLQQVINLELVNQGAPANLINFIADNATQKIIIQFSQATTQIDFTQANTIRTILGFNSVLVPDPNPTTGAYYQKGDVEAQFNNVDYFLIHSDIVNYGIQINNKYTQTVRQVLITEAPGSQIASHIDNPPRIPCPELIGMTKKSLRFWLTNQNNELVPTSGNNWSVSYEIHYTIEDDENEQLDLLRSIQVLLSGMSDIVRGVPDFFKRLVR